MKTLTHLQAFFLAEFRYMDVLWMLNECINVLDMLLLSWFCLTISLFFGVFKLGAIRPNISANSYYTNVFLMHRFYFLI